MPTATTSWPTTQAVRVAEPHGRGQVAGALRAQHRQVGERVRAHDANRRLDAVEEVGAAARGVGHHVGVRHQHPVPGDDDRGAGTPADPHRATRGVTSAATALTVRE